MHNQDHEIFLPEQMQTIVIKIKLNFDLSTNLNQSFLLPKLMLSTCSIAYSSTFGGVFAQL